MGEHLTADGEFQSDKYDWCPPGFLPLKLSDRGARDLMWLYAERRRKKDPVFADDLQQALINAGYTPMKGLEG